jgi:hypothetical protein
VEDVEKRDKFGALQSPVEKEYRNAFLGFLKSGLAGVPQEDRRLLLERRTDDQSASM